MYLKLHIIVVLMRMIFNVLIKKPKDCLLVMKLNNKSVTLKMVNGSKVYSHGLL